MAKDRPKKSTIPSFAKLTKGFADLANTYADERITEFAEDELTRFRMKILRQQFASFHAVPLSRARLDEKESWNLDLRVMIATKHYVDSIQVMRRRYINGTISYQVGFPANLRAVGNDGLPTDITLREVARIQEYGSNKAHIPARPHWRPHLQEMTVRATVLRVEIARQVLKLLKGKRKA